MCPAVVGTPALEQLLAFSKTVRASTDDVVMSIANQLSTRQMIRICRRVSQFQTEALGDAIHRACLSRFVPSLVKSALVQLLDQHHIKTSRFFFSKNRRHVFSKNRKHVFFNKLPVISPLRNLQRRRVRPARHLRLRRSRREGSYPEPDPKHTLFLTLNLNPYPIPPEPHPEHPSLP